jgi:hypothetical protein
MSRKNDYSIDRGSEEDQDRWLAELEAAEAADDFPAGGSVILTESPSHALKVAEELQGQGHRTIVRGVYVRTTAEMQRTLTSALGYSRPNTRTTRTRRPPTKRR